MMKNKEFVYVMCDWCSGKGREFDDKLPENGMQCRNCRGTGKVDAALLTLQSDELRTAYLRTSKSDSYLGRTITIGDLYKSGARYVAKYGDGLAVFGDAPVGGEPTDRDLLMNRFRFIDNRKSIGYYSYNEIIAKINASEHGYITVRHELTESSDFEIKILSGSTPAKGTMDLSAYLRPMFTADDWAPDERESAWQLDKYGIFFDYEWFKVKKNPRTHTTISTEALPEYSGNNITISKSDFSGGDYMINIEVTASGLIDNPAEILEIGDNVRIGHGTIGTIVQVCGSGEFMVEVPNIKEPVIYIQTRHNNKV